MFADTFIRRPILASVCSLILILGGLIAIPTMPVAQYPSLAPPVITVSAFYTGANAQEVETAVTTPLEQAINGVEGMLYMTSSSTNSGVSTINITFDVTRDQDVAQVDVQNRVNQTLGRMPAEVRTTGITVQKSSTGFVMAVGTTTCMVVGLTFLPALLNILSKAGWTIRKTQRDNAQSTLGREEPRF